MTLHTITALPDGERVHALFLGYGDGTYDFEVTGLGTVGIPEADLRVAGDLDVVMRGEDMNLKREEDTVVVWRVV